MPKKLAAILLLMGIVSSAIAQPLQKRDSLLHALSLEKDDSNKVNTLLKLGDQFDRSDPDSAKFYYQKAGTLSDKINYEMGTLRYMASYADQLNLQSKFDEALEINLKSIALAKKLGLPKRIAVAYSNTGITYYNLSNILTATDYFIKAVTIMEQQPLETKSEKKDLAGLYANVAGIFSEIQQYDKAYMYGLKAIAMSRELQDSGTLTRSLNNTSYVLFCKKNFDSALLCANQAYQIALARHNLPSQRSATLTMANIYQEKNDNEQMLKYAKLGLESAKMQQDSDGISKALLFIAYYNFNNRDYVAAQNFAEQGLAIAKANQLNTHMADEYLILSDIELAKGDIENYHRLRHLSDSMKDVVLSEQMLQTTQELETKYSVGKKEMQIDSLAKEKTIQGLEIKQKRQTNYALIGALIILGIISLLYYRYYQQKKALLLSADALQKQKITELEKEKLLSATQAIVQGQEEERTRLAKDLHDGLGGILSSTKYSLSNMKQNFIVTPDNADAFERTMAMMDQSITELRRVAHNMMPETLMKLSLSEALQDFCFQVTQSGALKVNYQSFGTEDLQLEDAVKITIYRVVQELVNNSIKHAQAKNSTVQLLYSENKLNLTVEDDGNGFDKSILDAAAGIGYKNLQSRIDFLKGSIDIQTEPGKGTSIYIEIPLTS